MIPLPPAPTGQPFHVNDGPSSSEVYIGTTENDCLYVYGTTNATFASATTVDPAQMLSGNPVTVSWVNAGETRGNDGLMVWGWSQTVTFHRVNPDGTPYHP